MKELKLAWRYVRRHWWQYILGILALFIVDAVNTYVPRFTGEITNDDILSQIFSKFCIGK